MTDKTHKVHPKLKELSDILSGRWRVKGHDIEGEAEYKIMQDGLLLVQTVDFVVSGTPMKVMQHIMYDQATDTLQARYMDTMGDNSIYIWQLNGHTMRVSLGSKDADTYFEAIFNNDYSEYAGTWHYAGTSGPDSDEARITYTRVR